VLLPRPDLLQLPVQGQLPRERLLLEAPRLLVQRQGLREGLLVQACSPRLTCLGLLQQADFH